MEKLKQEICTAFNTSLDTVAKNSYRGGPVFTVSIVLDRLLSSTFISLDKSFPEILSRSTITTMLKKIFKGKESSAQHWNTFILSKISMRKCPICNIILHYSCYYENNNCCKACDSERHKLFYVENTDKVLDRNREWKKANPDKVLSQASEYYNTHKAESKARNIKRKIGVDRATPIWANIEAMNLIYSNREEGEHVDHIIPLQHPLVCGLHCEFNLQYLSAFDNVSKSNKFDPETYKHELPY